MTEITSATLAYSGTTVTLYATNIDKPRPKVTAKGFVPFRADGEIVQYLGHKSKIITMTIDIHGATKDTDKTNLELWRDNDYVCTYTDSEEGAVDVFVEETPTGHVAGRESSLYSGTLRLVRV